jgi:hypothetical protein
MQRNGQKNAINKIEGGKLQEKRIFSPVTVLAKRFGMDYSKAIMAFLNSPC